MTTRQLVRDTQGILDAVYNRDPMLVPDDTTVYFEDKYIPLEDQTDLKVNGDVIKYGYASNGGALSSFVRNKDLMKKVNDVKIHGHGTIQAPWDYTGNVFCIFGDNWLVEDVKTPSWAGGRYMFVGGDNWEVRGVNARNCPSTTNNGGIRVAGGSGWKVSRAHVESGDDTYQVVPVFGDPLKIPMAGLSVGSGVFEYSTGRSTDARFMNVALMKADQFDKIDPTPMTQSIENVWFRDLRGEGGSLGLSVINQNSQGFIRGIRYIGGFTDMGQSTAKLQSRDVYIANNEGFDAVNEPYAAGGVYDVKSKGHRLRNPRTSAVVQIAGQRVDGIDLFDLIAA